MGEVLNFPARPEVELAFPLAAGAEGISVRASDHAVYTDGPITAMPVPDIWADVIDLRTRSHPERPFINTETTSSLAEDLPQEEIAKARFVKFLGETAVSQAMREESPEAGPASSQTLAKSLTEANKGDQEAMRRVDINVSSATSEGWFKKGHFRTTEKELNPAGEVVQFGLTTENMHRDSLILRPDRPRQLKEFTLAEARNGFREQELVRNDELQDSWLIVASCVPENLPEEQLDYRGDGYFTRSMTYSLQGTTQEGSQITTEVIFDQGTDASEYSNYEERQAGRFDILAIGKVYEKLGLPAPTSALEMLERPLKVPKRLMPGGMVDFWRWVDEAADELRGNVIVRTEQEYIVRKEQSREREESLSNAKQVIKAELLVMGGTFEIENDMEAVKALWELVRKHGPEEAAINDHIDPIAFGPDAAEMIYEARRYINAGDNESAQLWIQSAQEEATVSGCGGGSCGLEKVNKNSVDGRDLADKVKAEEGDEVVRDKERSCKCGAKSVIYAYNDDKVNKYCDSCRAFESKRKKAA